MDRSGAMTTDGELTPHAEAAESTPRTILRCHVRDDDDVLSRMRSLEDEERVKASRRQAKGVRSGQLLTRNRCAGSVRVEQGLSNGL